MNVSFAKIKLPSVVTSLKHPPHSEKGKCKDLYKNNFKSYTLQIVRKEERRRRNVHVHGCDYAFNDFALERPSIQNRNTREVQGWFNGWAIV